MILQSSKYGLELAKNDTEENIVFIKGKYIFDDEKLPQIEPGSEYILENLKSQQVIKLQRKYHITEPKKFQRKINIWVVLPFCLISLIHFMTRFTIAVASEQGMKEDLKITDHQYNIASAIFFVPYVLLELFSSLILKYIRPHYFMSFYILCLGVTVLSNGFVTDYKGLLICRFFTGLFQSNSSAIYYILANYFINHQSQQVFTLYYSFGTIGGIISVLITKVCSKVDLLYHWSWIFIIEGIITMILSIILFFSIPDFPEGARFLNDEETVYIVKKLEIYNGKSGYQLKFSIKDILSVLKDPMIWWGSLMYLGILSCSYGYAYFEPTIISNTADVLTNVDELVLQGLPFVLALIFSNLLAYFSDLIARRFPFILTCSLLSLTGLLIIYENPQSYLINYVGLNLTIVGLSCGIPMIVCWFTLNFAGHLRKIVATTCLVSFGNLGGIFSVFLFNNNQAPFYSLGIRANIGFLNLGILAMLCYVITLFLKTKKKTNENYREFFETLSTREKIFWGDQNPNFKYLL